MTEDEFIQTDQREREMQNQLTITMEPEENNEVTLMDVDDDSEGKAASSDMLRQKHTR